MELIDTHLHLIWRDRFGYSWTKDVPKLKEGDFSLAMARGLYGGEVIGSIFMEVGVDDADYKAEGRYVARLVKDGSLLGQIVSCRPESDPEFAAWVEECADLGVVGFRRILHVVPDDVSEPEAFRENIRLIGRAGKPFDMNFLGRTLPLAAALVRACPGTQMVLDHCGTPDIAGGAFDSWRAGIEELAEIDNVAAVKMSGIAAYATPGTATFETLAPWLDVVLEAFGPLRMVWGSDWPVVDLGGGLPGWLGISRAWMNSRLSSDEAAQVGRFNAERIYGVRAG
ncbi:MAG: amidohydrolase family protein [Rhodobacterales bacterium]|nr:amidohydrolase family protein [Rhodobacterales bacterium]